MPPQPAPGECRFCGRHVKFMKEHERNMHDGDAGRMDRIPCTFPYCTSKFLNKAALRKHFEKHHRFTKDQTPPVIPPPLPYPQEQNQEQQQETQPGHQDLHEGRTQDEQPQDQQHTESTLPRIEPTSHQQNQGHSVSNQVKDEQQSTASSGTLVSSLQGQHSQGGVEASSSSDT
ncbi:hypothetical protein B0O80DRAFT_501860 [Mortierella sp. GBAus27b]|nr:hypothetical protein B0O80DRAFT_501860 [Mortierella sp. GBAus27b]